MNKIQKHLDNFNIKQIADSGQCFRIKEISDNRYSCITGKNYLELTDDGNGNCTFFCSENDFKNIWSDYFDLSTDYGKIINDIDTNDHYLCEAASFANGIRILKQDIWEMLVTFIVSQRMSIPRIASIIENMSELAGDAFTCDGKTYHAFPTPTQLSQADLSEFSLGYRDKYIKRLADDVCENRIDLKFLYSPHELNEYMDFLCSLYGVGIKVANCTILFGLHQLKAFPIDTWIGRIVEREYNGHFPVDKYEYPGVLQQYIFYYERYLVKGIK